MRKIMDLILALILTINLAACDRNALNDDALLDTPDSDIAEFEIVDDTFYGTILVDKSTGVLYYWIASNSGGITPIYNTDGTLKIYEQKYD